MKSLTAIYFAFLTLALPGCGTEIGNGDKQKSRPDEQTSGSPGNVSDPNGQDERSDAPKGSPFDANGFTSIPVLGAFSNYCKSPAMDLNSVSQTFSSESSQGFTLEAKLYQVTITYKTGFSESVSGNKLSNFAVGLSTYTCQSFSQEATVTVPPLAGTFTKKSQTLASPQGSTLTVVWYVDEDSGLIARVSFVDPQNTVTITNKAY